MNASIAPGDAEPQHTAAGLSEVINLERMLGAGLALIPIPRRSKGPTFPGWNTRAACITDPLRAGELVGHNAGLAHAYSGTCAVDIDNFQLATEWLRPHDVDLVQLCMAEDSVQVRSGAANRAKLLYRVDEPLRSVRISPDGAVMLELRCATADGLTVQDVVYGTHPSGSTYQLLGDPLSIPPIPPALLELWQAQLHRESTNFPPKTTFAASLSVEQEDELRGALAHLNADDREQWIEAGAALHVYGTQGYALWLEWSQRSPKFDAKDQWRVWNSFRDDRPGVTIRTLFAKAQARGWVNPLAGGGAGGAESETEDGGPIIEPPLLAPEGYHGILRDLVDAACANSEADPAAVGAHYLARVAATIGRKPFVQIGDKRTGLRFWPLIVGGTSSGRKGTADDLPRRVMEEAAGILQVEAERNATAEPELRVLAGLATGEGLIFAIRDPGGKVDNEGNPSDPGIADKRLLVVDTEFASTLTKASRTDSVLSALIRKAFDGATLDNPTKVDPHKASRPHIGIIGHITPRELIEKLSATECTNGFANRFLLVHSRRPKLVPLPRPTPEKVLHKLAETTATIIYQARGFLELGSGSAIEISMTPEAEVTWNEMYAQIVEDRPGIVGDLTQRAALHCWTLAALFALLDCGKRIEPAHLRAAKAWIDYTIATATFVFSVHGRQAKADKTAKLANKVLGIIEGSQGISRTGISKALLNHVSSNDIGTALQELLARRPAVIEQVTESTGGRPRTIYCASARSAKSEESEKSAETAGAGG